MNLLALFVKRRDIALGTALWNASILIFAAIASSLDTTPRNALSLVLLKELNARIAAKVSKTLYVSCGF